MYLFVILIKFTPSNYEVYIYRISARNPMRFYCKSFSKHSDFRVRILHKKKEKKKEKKKQYKQLGILQWLFYNNLKPL